MGSILELDIWMVLFTWTGKSAQALRLFLRLSQHNGQHFGKAPLIEHHFLNEGLPGFFITWFLRMFSAFGLQYLCLLIGKFGSSSALFTAHFVSIELVSTVFRGAFFGICTIIEALGDACSLDWWTGKLFHVDLRKFRDSEWFLVSAIKRDER